MNFFKTHKVIQRLDQMIDNAIEGKPIETTFDETKMSALETKLARFLEMNHTHKAQLTEQKLKVHALISDISHQTKTPLSNVLLHTMLLAESDLSEKDKLCVEVLTHQTEKLNFLIDALIKASRLESGMVQPLPRLESVSQLIEDVIHQARPKAELKNIELQWSPTEVMAKFDPKWTSEALLNIVDNAIKYTHSNTVIQLSVTAFQLFCRIDVKDQGIGISEAEIPMVFQRFYRSEQVRDLEGVGLGLYLAREIIASQDGYIKVKSKPYEGTTFSVYLQL